MSGSAPGAGGGILRRLREILFGLERGGGSPVRSVVAGAAGAALRLRQTLGGVPRAAGGQLARPESGARGPRSNRSSGGGSSGGGFSARLVGGSAGGRDLIHAKANKSGVAGALRTVRYLRDREKEPGRDPDHEAGPAPDVDPGPGGGLREELRPVVGDADVFIEAVRERVSGGRQVAYMSIVISPEDGRLEISNAEFVRMAEPWTVDRDGNGVPCVGYVHRDTEHPHLHLVAARHYFSREEMTENKGWSRNVVREVEMDRELGRILAREPRLEPEMEPGLEPELEAEPETWWEPEPELVVWPGLQEGTELADVAWDGDEYHDHDGKVRGAYPEPEERDGPEIDIGED